MSLRRGYGFGHSLSRDPIEAAHEAVSAAVEDPREGDLVLLFANASYDLERLYEAALGTASGASVVGCTTVGQFTSELQVPVGCVAAFLPGDEMSFGVSHLARDDNDVDSFARTVAERARADAGPPSAYSALLLLCDALAPDLRATARGAYEVTTSLVPLVGGAAGDDLYFKETSTFGEGRVLSNGLAAVWIESERPLAVALDHGWHPFGSPMLVTRAEGPIIWELDGMPALDVYLSERGAALKHDARSFGEKCQERPIGMPNAEGRYEMRHIHQSVPGGGIVLVAAIPENTVVQVMESDDESLLDGARSAAVAARRRLGRDARAVIIFDCCTRPPLLGQRSMEEIELICSALGGAAGAGFYTCGEFGRVGGSMGIHNSSVGLLALV
jgi:hypothetical protein